MLLQGAAAQQCRADGVVREIRSDLGSLHGCGSPEPREVPVLRLVRCCQL